MFIIGDTYRYARQTPGMVLDVAYTVWSIAETAERHVYRLTLQEPMSNFFYHGVVCDVYDYQRVACAIANRDYHSQLVDERE